MNKKMRTIKKTDNIRFQIFTQLAPLCRFSHRVAMSVCVSVCLSVCLRHWMQFFPQGLSLALRSDYQFPGCKFGESGESSINLKKEALWLN